MSCEDEDGEVSSLRMPFQRGRVLLFPNLLMLVLTRSSRKIKISRTTRSLFVMAPFQQCSLKVIVASGAQKSF
jgi:hypothetical protein